MIEEFGFIGSGVLFSKERDELQDSFEEYVTSFIEQMERVLAIFIHDMTVCLDGLIDRNIDLVAEAIELLEGLCAPLFLLSDNIKEMLNQNIEFSKETPLHHIFVAERMIACRATFREYRLFIVNFSEKLVEKINEVDKW